MLSTLLAKLTRIAVVIVLVLLIGGTDVVGPVKQIIERTVFFVRLG